MVTTLETAMVVAAASGMASKVATTSGEIKLGLQHKGWSSWRASEVEEDAAEGAIAAVAAEAVTEAVAEAVGGVAEELETA